MKTIRLTIKGIVQKVGYRNIVYRTARELKIKGYVKNLDDPDESVEIVAQHPDAKALEEFITRIKIDDGFIKVDEIAKSVFEEEKYVKFEVIRGSYDEENAERLDIAAIHLKNMGDKIDITNKKLDSGFSGLENKLDSFASATSQKFDLVDTKYGKISDRLEKISDSLEELVEILRAFKQK